MDTTLDIGRIVITKNAMETLTTAGIVTGLTVHVSRKPSYFREESRGMVKDIDPGPSSCTDSRGNIFWVVTELVNETKTTTVMLPEEY